MTDQFRILYLYRMLHCNLPHYFLKCRSRLFSFRREDTTRPCNVASFILNITISFLFIRINLCIMYTMEKKDGKKKEAGCVKYQQMFMYCTGTLSSSSRP